MKTIYQDDPICGPLQTILPSTLQRGKFSEATCCGIIKLGEYNEYVPITLAK